MPSIHLLVLLAALPSCAAVGSAPAAAPPASRAAGTSSFLVKEAKLADGAVSVRARIPLPVRGRAPAVIAQLGDPRPLTDAGIIAVTYTVDWKRVRRGQPTPDPSARTVGKWVLSSPSAAVLGEPYLRDIVTTAETYVPAVLDWLVTLPDVDPGRLGMAGASTNGFVALQACAVDPRLRAVVTIAACGDYPGFLQGSSMGMDGQPLTLAPEYARWISEQQVLSHPARLTHAALLMINRVGDPLIPVACADETARVLREAYASAGAPQRFQYDRLAAEGHGMGAEEKTAALAWLKRWLGGGAPAAPA